MGERWQNYYSETDLQMVQTIEHELLRTFIHVCEALSLEYIVYGGTLLGVEKYQGMIPWDDDVDVALPRDSYQRFCELAPTVLPPEYYIQNPYNCLATPFPYTKLRRRGTKFVECVHRNLPIESGIYIDIYPIDRIPDDERLRKKQFQRVRWWILLYVVRQSRLYDKQSECTIDKVKNVAKWCLYHLLKVLPRDYCVSKIDHYMTLYDDTETKRFAALNSPNYNNIFLQFYPLLKGLFDGIEVCIPSDHQRHLRMRYGNYEELPPESERFGHIPYILDFGDLTERQRTNESDT